MKWYQILFMVLGVYVAAVVVTRAIRNQRDLNSLRNGMNENLCLLIKQLKKYDKEIAELQAELATTPYMEAVNPGGTTPVILPVDPAVTMAKINELKLKRIAMLAMISEITSQNPYVVYCKPCDCEKHDEEPHGDLPPTTTQQAIANSSNIADIANIANHSSGIANHSRVGANGGVYVNQ